MRSAAALAVSHAGPPSGPRPLGPAAMARRDAPEALAVRRAQSVYLDEWNEALLVELESGTRGRSQVLRVVIDSLSYALRAWVAHGHSPTSVGSYHTAGALGVEHARAADLVETLRQGYESQESAPQTEVEGDT